MRKNNGLSVCLGKISREKTLYGIYIFCRIINLVSTKCFFRLIERSFAIRCCFFLYYHYSFSLRYYCCWPHRHATTSPNRLKCAHIRTVDWLKLSIQHTEADCGHGRAGREKVGSCWLLTFFYSIFLPGCHRRDPTNACIAWTPPTWNNV